MITLQTRLLQRTLVLFHISGPIRASWIPHRRSRGGQFSSTPAKINHRIFYFRPSDCFCGTSSPEQTPSYATSQPRNHFQSLQSPPRAPRITQQPSPQQSPSLFLVSLQSFFRVSKILGAHPVNRDLFDALRGCCLVSLTEVLVWVGAELYETCSTPAPAPETKTSGCEQELEVYFPRCRDAYFSVTM